MDPQAVRPSRRLRLPDQIQDAFVHPVQQQAIGLDNLLRLEIGPVLVLCPGKRIKRHRLMLGLVVRIEDQKGGRQIPIKLLAGQEIDIPGLELAANTVRQNPLSDMAGKLARGAGQPARHPQCQGQRRTRTRRHNPLNPRNCPHLGAKSLYRLNPKPLGGPHPILPPLECVSDRFPLPSPGLHMKRILALSICQYSAHSFLLHCRTYYHLPATWRVIIGFLPRWEGVTLLVPLSWYSSQRWVS